MEGRWTIHIRAWGHLVESRAPTEPLKPGTFPVVPCDDAAIERVAAELAHQRGWKWQDVTTPREALRTSAKRALRAAGETP